LIRIGSSWQQAGHGDTSLAASGIWHKWTASISWVLASRIMMSIAAQSYASR
jgi:hypothetical protein